MQTQTQTTLHTYTNTYTHTPTDSSTNDQALDLYGTFKISHSDNTTAYLPYETKFWREKILANLANFTKLARSIKKLILKDYKYLPYILSANYC